ncbi:Asparagine synthetase [glutamine-hydrolyzing] [hydrothermal vent metagenome]|uniref:Asparagine synthetase [glutamine-hydrolyzing] n=1 Tax=hydrothermal vent metagenome TaxID=652676 RepID=A0A3B0Z7Q8_9ZZZZ
MCGLLALVGQIDEKCFKRALDLQLHRGPDDWGVKTSDGVMFGHRRLSVIDLASHSKQPMVNVTNDIVGVFNGEIYNYKELREELLLKGYRFKTSSDTEVLLNAFHCYKEAALNKFIGMFAFVIYDLRDKTLYIARDRLGVKPLFYKKTSKGLCFSSEVKSIQSIEGSKGDINLFSISAYLSYRYPLLESSFYNGIDSLKPGHYLKVKNGKLEQYEYWDCHNFVHEQNYDKGEEFYLGRLRELFESSVAYRAIADVPVGAYLSGGVDSSAIVSQMASQTNEAINTFTIGFKEQGFNEFKFASEVAEQYQTNHHEIMLSSEHYLDNMLDLIRIKDAPLGVPNEVPLYLMSKELKKKVTVVLSGEGADEIFGGYGKIFRSADDYQKLKDFSVRKQKNFSDKYGRNSFPNDFDHFFYLYNYTNDKEKSNVFSDSVNDLDLNERIEAPFKSAFSRVDGAGYASKMMYAFEKLHLPGLLQRVDATTMGASVEARVPFTDHRLVEFAFTIPEKYKLKWREDPATLSHLTGDEVSEIHDIPKYILKKSFENKLSDNILYRKKMGFPVPLASFIGDNNSLLKDRLLNGELVKQDITTRKKVSDFLNIDFSKRPKKAMTAWMLLNLEIFLSNS